MNQRLISPKDLALAIGASESSIRRWVDSGKVQLSRTIGGHRRIPVTEAVRFIREAKVPLLRPELLGLPALPEGSASDVAGDEGNAIAAAIEAGDAERLRALSVAWYVSGRSLAELFDGPVRGVMNALGAGWRNDEGAILAEHRATEVCAQAVPQLRMLMPPPADDAPLALGGAVEGDAHALASVMAAAVLAETGYRDVNFGGTTPVKLLSRAAADQRPRLVWLSVNTPPDARLVRGVEGLLDQLQKQGVPLVVGGIHAGALPAHGNMHVSRSMAELSAFARGLLRGSGKRSGK